MKQYVKINIIFSLFILGCLCYSSADTIKFTDNQIITGVHVGDMTKDFVLLVVPRSLIKSMEFDSEDHENHEKIEQVTEQWRILSSGSPVTLEPQPQKTQSVAPPAQSATMPLVLDTPSTTEVETPIQTVTNAVKGRLLLKKKPAARYAVAIRKIPSFSFGGLVNSSNSNDSVFLETTTDEKGEFQFINVSPGQYDLLWKLPASDRWIRRLSDQPDVVIQQGDTIRLKDLNIAKKTIN